METLTVTVEHYLEKNYADTLFEPTKYLKSDSCVERELLSRGVFLGRAVTVLITKSVDIIVGIVATAFTFLTLGMNKDCARAMSNFMFESVGILGEPMYQLVKMLNPHIKETDSEDLLVSAKPLYKLGLITRYLVVPMYNQFEIFSNSENVIVRHVASRTCTALGVLVCTVTRVVDGAIGLVASVFMFLTLGKFESLNNLAIRGLQVTRIVAELPCGVLMTINPWSFNS